MKGTVWIVACGIGVLLTAVLLIGAESATRAPARWEYGIYIESPDNYEWQGPAGHVRATNAVFFFERMGLPTDAEVSAHSGRLQALLLNHLGQQGWELVDVASDSNRNAYWFKRPK